jgi:hypothetical protein
MEIEMKQTRITMERWQGFRLGVVSDHEQRNRKRTPSSSTWTSTSVELDLVFEFGVGDGVGDWVLAQKPAPCPRRKGRQ